jgi:hypothetical protein
MYFQNFYVQVIVRNHTEQESRLMKCEWLIRTSLIRSPGFPGGMPLSRQASHRLMKCEVLIRTSAGPESRLMKCEVLIQISPLRSPGFNRIRRSRQGAPAPAGIPPAKAGTPGHFISGLIAQRSSAGPGVPGRMPQPRQASHRLKPGLPVTLYPDYISKSSSNYRLRTTDYGLRTTDYGLRTTDYGLRTTDYGLRTTPLAPRAA